MRPQRLPFGFCGAVASAHACEMWKKLMPRRDLIIAGLLFLAATSGWGETSVAIIMTGQQPTHEPLLTLAEAKVSALADVQLLERRQLDRILQEQHLAMTGLADPKMVMKIGQLVRADVIAHIEFALGTGEPASLVVFDAQSGARLCDVTLPPGLDPAVTAITQGIQSAIQKLRLPPTARHMVSVLTVRNADLPRAMDQFCEAVGRLLERDLTGSPNLVVLERSGLAPLNQERELPTAMTASNNLLATVVQLQGDVSRAATGTGLQAVVVLGSPANPAVRRVRTQIAGENAVELAEALAAAIRQELAVAAWPAPDKSAHNLEARQYFREALLRRTHAETMAGWRAAEAAHALEPDDLPMENLLMCYLLEAGSQRALPEALEFGIRSLSFRELRLRNALSTADRDRMQEEEARERDAIMALARFTRQIARPARTSADPPVRNKYDQFAKQFLTLDWDRFEAWAQLATKNPQNFSGFTAIMASPNALTVCTLLTETEFVVRLDRYLRRWLEVANALPSTSRPGQEVQELMQRIKLVFNFVAQFITGIRFDFKPEHFKMLKPVAAEIAASPNPIISAQGRDFLSFVEASIANGVAVNGGVTTGVQSSNIDAQFSELSRTQIKQALEAFLATPAERRTNVVANVSSSASSQNLTAGYDAKTQLELAILQFSGKDQWLGWPNVTLETAFALYPKPGRATDPAETLDGYTDEIDIMLTNQFVYAPVLEYAIDLATRQRLANPKLLRQVNEISAAVEDANFGFSTVGIGRQSWKRKLDAFQKQTAEVAAIQKNRDHLPWDKPIRLLDVAQFPQIDAFVYVGVDDATVYGLGVQDKNRQTTDNVIELFLVRAPLAGGEARIVNHATFTTSQQQDCQPIPHVELVNLNLVMLVAEAPTHRTAVGVFAMPLDGKPVVRVDEKWELPNHEIGAFTVVGRQIFLGLRGYLVKCDLESNQTEILASSRRADKQSDLDNGELFQTKFMFPDAKRGRIVVTVERGQRIEFWALSLADGRLTLLDSRPGTAATESIGSQAGADQLFFSSPFHHEVFHLDTAKLETLSTGLPMEDQEWKLGPHFIHQGYLWSGGAFGRTSLADKKTERFPWVSPPDPEATPPNRYPFFRNIPYYFAPLANSRNVLLGTAAGAWLLPLH